MSGLNNKVVGDWLNLVKLIIIILHGMYFMCDLKYMVWVDWDTLAVMGNQLNLYWFVIISDVTVK